MSGDRRGNRRNQPPTECSAPGSIAIVDDHRFVAETLAALLGHLGIEATVVTGPTLTAVADELIARRPEAVLLDFHLGELGPATPLIGTLTDHRLPVVVLTADPDPLTKARSLEAGAAALVTKTVTPDDLLETLAGVTNGTRVVAEEERFALLAELRRERTRMRRIRSRFDRLTRREADVLRMICDGLSAAEIAEESYVSLATVRTQIRSVLAKLEVNSQLAAAAEAHRTGWVDGPDRVSSIVAMTGTA